MLVGLFFEPVLFASLEFPVLGEGTHRVSPSHPPAAGSATICPLRPLQVPRYGLYHNIVMFPLSQLTVLFRGGGTKVAQPPNFCINKTSVSFINTHNQGLRDLGGVLEPLHLSRNT